MNFVGLIFLDDEQWQTMGRQEKDKLIEDWNRFDQDLRDFDHSFGARAFPETRDPISLRFFQGQAIAAEGDPGTVEQLAGLVFLKARDLNHAISLVSNHPAIKFGSIEIKTLTEAI